VNLLTTSTDLISIFLFTTLFLFLARKVAQKVGLVDKPNFRKRHQGLIPLVGGISVFAGVCFTFTVANYYIPHAALYLSWLACWMTALISASKFAPVFRL
jgi:UDP-GlcNAc:undecaprenyl-phosphate/decaprenyl-phosphate GlcNAc-1-phosphate transferase